MKTKIVILFVELLEFNTKKIHDLKNVLHVLKDYLCDSKITLCQTCENDKLSFIRKFMLRLTISDGEDETYATMFDATKYLIGCSVIEYYKLCTKSYCCSRNLYNWI